MSSISPKEHNGKDQKNNVSISQLCRDPYPKRPENGYGYRENGYGARDSGGYGARNVGGYGARDAGGYGARDAGYRDDYRDRGVYLGLYL